MARHRIGPVRQDTAIGEVRETEAERHRRPGIDRSECDEDRADHSERERMALQPG